MSGFGKIRGYLRKKTRIALKVSTVLDTSQNARDTQSFPFQTQDIGVGGIGLETLVHLELGDYLDLELTLPSGKSISARATVKNIRPEKRGTHVIYEAGLEFIQISDEDRKAISDYVGSGDFMV